jgi:hypothetical protein
MSKSFTLQGIVKDHEKDLTDRKKAEQEEQF